MPLSKITHRFLFTFVFLVGLLTTHVTKAQPVDFLLKNSTICIGDSIDLKGLIESQPPSIAYARWKEGANYLSAGPVGLSAIVTPATTSTYTLEYALSSGGATITKEAVVFVTNYPSVTVLPHVRVCQNSYITLKELTFSGEILYWVQQVNGQAPVAMTTLSFPVTESSSYTAIATNQCGNDSATIYVEMIELPTVQTKEEVTACYGDTIDLAVVKSTGTLTWALNGQPINSTRVAVYDSETYTVVAGNECGMSPPATLIVKSYPRMTIMPDKLPAFSNGNYYSVTLRADNATSPIVFNIAGTMPPGLSFTSNGSISGTPNTINNEFQIYPITIFAIDGHYCMSEKNYVLEQKWEAPTAFIPTGSNAKNKIFLPKYNVVIYDRQGYLIYEGVGWDGTDKNGRQVPNGTYFYKVTMVVDDTNQYYSGYITVLPPK